MARSHLHALLTTSRRALRLAAVVAFMGAGEDVGAQFTVDALEQHVTVGRDSLNRVIAVRSDLDSLQQLQVIVRDWNRDSTGANVFGEVGSMHGSCGGRLEVFPRTLQLGARATDFIRLTYTPTGPDDTGCWAVVLLEPVRPRVAPTQGRMGATIIVQTGVKFYVHPARAEVRGEIIYADVERVAANDTATARPVVAVRFENTGTDHLQASSVFEFRDATGTLVERVSGPTTFLVPGAFRDLVVPVPGLQPGRYVAVILMDFGGAEIQAAQVDFEIP